MAEKERNSGTGEGGSMWIDYLLLPHKLDHHLSQLAAGTISTPSPAQLILMFLDQAILSHKTASTTSKNDKEAPTFHRQLTGKTATLLCERAAKVALSMGLTLPEIETIPSPQNQYLLLQALIDHDQERSLIHNCNLHRWFIRNILHSSAHVPALSSLVSNDLDAVQNTTGNATSDTLTSGSTSFIAAEENNSISFLENILRREEGIDLDTSSNQTIEYNSSESSTQNPSKIETTKNSCLSKGYRCQVMLDVAEIHFMRGRIRLAHDFLTKCGQLLAEFISSKGAGGDGKSISALSTEDNCDWHPDLLMQKDRVAGLIMACRMILGMYKFTSSSGVEYPEGIGLDEPPLKDLIASSTATQSVIVCEQSRWLLRRIVGEVVVSEQGKQKLPEKYIFSKEFEHLGQDESKNFNIAMLHMQSEQLADSEISEGIMEKEEPPRKLRKKNADGLCSKGLEKHPSMMNKSTDLFATCAQENLSQTFLERLMGHNLPWDYRFSLAEDFCIPVSTRCQLMACNLIQEILTGASLESFLHVRNDFYENREAVEFLMRTIAGVLKRLGVREPETDESQSLSESMNRKGNSYFVRKDNYEKLASRLRELVKYVCCTLDKSWCWTLVLDSSLLTDVEVQNLRGYSSDLQLFSPVHRKGQIAPFLGSSEGEITGEMPMIAPSEIKGHRSCQYHAKSNVGALFHVMQAESSSDLERHFCLLNDGKDSITMQLQQHVSSVSLRSGDNFDQYLQTCSSDDNFLKAFSIDQTSCYCRNAVTMASVLREKAFNAVESKKDYKFAGCLFKMLRVLNLKNTQCDLMLWLLETLEGEHGNQKEAAMDLPEIIRLKTYPSLGLLEYVVVKLIDNEYWDRLSEFCKWVAMLIDENKEGVEKTHSSAFQRGIGELRLMISLATCLEKLFCLSTSLQVTLTCSEEVNCSLQNLWQEFLQCLIVADAPVEKDFLKTDSTSQFQSNSLAMSYSSIYKSVREVPIVLKLSNSKVLTCLASCSVGWLQSCYLAGMTPWPFDVKRYGTLAIALAGHSLLLKSGASATHKSAPLLILPGLCREMFRQFLERLVSLPTVIEGGPDNGHAWLQGLADLAFEDDNHIEALRYYLQAGAIRSAHYCINELSMPQDVFTPWVIERMIRACRESGALLQAVILCQCLPNPDYNMAYLILQENLLITEKDIDLYFDCIWEVPIFELLINLHARAGDESRVNYLISLLQHPALNLHNPPSVRKAYVDILKQRFLQRFYDEIG